AQTDTVLASKDIHRHELSSYPSHPSLEADLKGCDGHPMEARLFWQGKAFMQVGKLTVTADRAGCEPGPGTCRVICGGDRKICAEGELCDVGFCVPPTL